MNSALEIINNGNISAVFVRALEVFPLSLSYIYIIPCIFDFVNGKIHKVLIKNSGKSTKNAVFIKYLQKNIEMFIFAQIRARTPTKEPAAKL